MGLDRGIGSWRTIATECHKMRQACQLPPFSSILSVYNLIYSIKTSILSSFRVTKGVAKNRLCMLILRENSIEEKSFNK